MLRRNLPPALLAEWPRSFTCHCGNTGKELTDIEQESAHKVNSGEENSPAALVDHHTRALIILYCHILLGTIRESAPMVECQRRLQDTYHYGTVLACTSVLFSPFTDQVVRGNIRDDSTRDSDPLFSGGGHCE